MTEHTIDWSARLPELLADIEELVTCESPTSDIAAGLRCAELVDALGARLLGQKAERIADAAGRVHLRWRFGAGDRVLILGHYDTVWPIGSLATHPFAVTGTGDGVLTGPGCFDMKTGLVQLFHAAAAQDRLDGLTILVTGDEETGSAGSQALIEAEARRVRAALVLEASEGGALKSARKGVATYDVEIGGRASHAGLQPHLGVNTTIELAHQVLAIAAVADASAGTTVTPTVAASGTTRNTVPDAARLLVDVRVATAAEQERVDAGLRALTPVLPQASVRVKDGPRRPPLPESASAALLARARRLWAELGHGELGAVAVGGGSDGNLTAGVGTPTLDGLGAAGGGAHADDEHVLVGEIPRRTALVTALVAELLGEE
ncbi:M20/M25/M40 family metallo-hydrolase [Catenulispora sp. NL8]|uniref:M20/M25/M40 family metallo-hydrolase n=1 Tax=Catenulispora pinistramenti TaxID=2705254 RepID=A0ABS5L5G5_9ACTN|nr:M20/M25/M40 family metallo-hydrolase [Catenulispora pinistramenti]MBS2553554.1 M20/M25/M40 family metallo-hydrolase [Catenulispora pinistramenti]